MKKGKRKIKGTLKTKPPATNVLPNPGSDAALMQGCKCPVLDNGHGYGFYKKDVFVINVICPLHGRIGHAAKAILNAR